MDQPTEKDVIITRSVRIYTYDSAREHLRHADGLLKQTMFVLGEKKVSPKRPYNCFLYGTITCMAFIIICALFVWAIKVAITGIPETRELYFAGIFIALAVVLGLTSDYMGERNKWSDHALAIEDLQFTVQDRLQNFDIAAQETAVSLNKRDDYFLMISRIVSRVRTLEAKITHM